MANYNPNRVKVNRSYTYEEMAAVHGVHKNTVAAWVKDGLPSLRDRRPYLILGAEARKYLKTRRESNKRKCKENEFYCLSCRVPVKPAENFVEYVCTTPTKGRLTGMCEYCGCIINKYAGFKDIGKYSLIFDLEKPIALKHINDTNNPPLNSDLTQ